MYIELPSHSLLQGGSVFFRQHFCDRVKNKKCWRKTCNAFLKKKRVTHGDSKKKIYFLKASESSAVPSWLELELDGLNRITRAPSATVIGRLIIISYWYSWWFPEVRAFVGHGSGVGAVDSDVWIPSLRQQQQINQNNTFRHNIKYYRNDKVKQLN